ncbi:MAG TPA: hypothetical protein VKG85_01145 [Actinomycetes bacterium]|nr:hypothetical protein [Actinomycetes bacterium]
MDTSALRDAYDTFLHEAGADAFGPDPSDGWGAQQVVAHMAVNDDLLTATTRQLLHGDPNPVYDNAPAQDPATLDAFAESVGGMSGLIDAVRGGSEALIQLIEILDEQVADTVVSVRIRDGDEYPIDGPAPWSRIIRAQHTAHLPAHTDQLRELRGYA